jgi:hypothetical protein
MMSEVAEFVVSVGPDGRIASQGNIDEAFRANPKLKAEAEKDEELERKGEQMVNDSDPINEDEENTKKAGGKLTMVEEVAEGRIGWSAMKLFLVSLGGVWFWAAYILGFSLGEVAILAQTYWLG